MCAYVVMTKIKKSPNRKKQMKASRKTILLSALLLSAGLSGAAQAQIDMNKKPVLVITNEPMTSGTPASTVSAGVPSAPIYNVPSKAPDITPDQISGAAYFDQTQTPVGRKIDQMRSDLFALQTRLGGVAEQISEADRNNQTNAAAYNASVATINTALQSGTTPGNPRLVAKLHEAEKSLDEIGNNVAKVNNTSVRVAELASMAAFLLEATRSTYALSGAIEEDHVRLAQLEDQINGVMVLIERLQLESNDRLSRTNAFLASERNNLRTLSMGVTSGNMFGRSLRGRGFDQASYIPSTDSVSMQSTGYAPMPSSAIPAPLPTERKPLAKIRFDRPDVNYTQPVYMAVQEALQKYPSGQIEIVAVHPQSANAAEVAIEATRARRNAESVMRSLEQMGVPMEKITMSASQSPEARSSEVHVFLR